MRLPQQGHIVSYNSVHNKRRVPAIVTSVQEYESGDFLLDVVCFFTNGTMHINSVPQGNEPGQWQWLDMVDPNEIISGSE